MPQYLKLAGEFTATPDQLIYVGSIVAGPEFLVAVPQGITTAQRRGMATQGLTGGLRSSADEGIGPTCSTTARSTSPTTSSNTPTGPAIGGSATVWSSSRTTSKRC